MIVTVDIPDVLIERLTDVPSSYRLAQQSGDALHEARSILWDGLRVACGQPPRDPEGQGVLL